MNLVDKIKQSESKLYLVLSGGGTEAISRLLKDGGASKVFLGAEVPYCESYLDFITNNQVDKAVSAETSLNMCMPDGWINEVDYQTLVVVGSTAALVKDNERDNREHQAYVSAKILLKTGDKFHVTSRTYHVVFKEDRSRAEEESLLSTLILAVAHEAMNLVKCNVTYRPYFESFGFTVNDEITLVDMR